MLILNLWGISFYPVVVVALGNDLLFNFIVGRCTVEDVSTRGASITKNLKFSKSQIAVKIYQEFASDYLVLIIS